jgi:cyclopropane-fatty-acyl-phospholipid synthase
MQKAAAGASPEAIRRHYDVGNDFYRLWLDPSLTYSCALWEEGDSDDILEVAQRRKIELHAAWAQARGAARVLDIGCGWGSVLNHLVGAEGVQNAVGLTLSQEQADWITRTRQPGVEVRLESWADHAPAGRYDGVISIGAFEHFARADWDDAKRVATYRAFFARCHSWLKPNGRLSLQTIAFSQLEREKAKSSPQGQFILDSIFPESDLPTLQHIEQASAGLFDLVQLRNDREHYERTCRVWCKRLTACRREAVAVAGEEAVARFVRYLKLAAALFQYGEIRLLRIAFRRLGN